MKPLTYIKIFVLIGLVFCIERACHKATDGFALVNIYAPLNTPLVGKPFDLDPKTAKQLNQPFYYLASGSQSYVFLSEDQQIVLKLFKFQHMRIPPWIDALPLPSFLAKKRDQKKKKKKKILVETLQSHQLAYENMKKEAGLLYVHLTPTSHIKQKITLHSKINKKHTISLDDVVCIVQKKADLAYTSITKWMEQGKEKEAKESIRKLLTLALLRCQKGLFDKDPDFSTNFGFIENEPVQVDVGRLSLDPKEADPEIYQDEMIRITRSFHNWIEKNHPDLLTFFDEEIIKVTERI